MLINDIKLPKSVDPRVKQILEETIEVINNGGYQEIITTVAPFASDPGEEGQSKIVVTGATMRIYKYASGVWWYSGLYTLLV